MTGRSLRPARVLAGWLEAHEAAALGLDEAAALRCREAVERRPAIMGAPDLAPPDPPLDALAAALAEIDPRFREGALSLVIVDLAEVVATQAVVATDEHRGVELGAGASSGELAAVTLPVTPAVLPVSAFDERAQVWVVRSRGASVAVAGRYVGAAEAGDPGSQCFGFVITAQPSRVTIGVHEGRIVLLDGHHRAASLVARGVRRAPVALDASPSLVLTQGNLSRAAILGPRPPRLGDYVDPDVSLDATISPTERVILVAATEVELPAS